MNRIQRVSSCLLVFFNIGLIVLPLSFVFLWLFLNHPTIQYGSYTFSMLWTPIAGPNGMIDPSTIQLTWLSKIIGLSGWLIDSSPVLFGFIVLKRIFRNYKNNIIFSYDNACQYKNLGYLFFYDALIAKPLSNLLIVLMATINNPPGERWISVTFGTPSLESLFCGFLVLVIAWVMMEGYRLQEEQHLII